MKQQLFLSDHNFSLYKVRYKKRNVDWLFLMKSVVNTLNCY